MVSGVVSGGVSGVVSGVVSGSKENERPDTTLDRQTHYRTERDKMTEKPCVDCDVKEEECPDAMYCYQLYCWRVDERRKAERGNTD